jgi:hypothetical protein
LGLLDTIKGWFTSAKDKVGDMERDAVDQAKDIAGGIKDKFDGGGADEGDDGGA